MVRPMLNVHAPLPVRLRDVSVSMGQDSRTGTINEAADRIDKLEIALHTIVGHGNITVERAKQVAREALAE